MQTFVFIEDNSHNWTCLFLIRGSKDRKSHLRLLCFVWRLWLGVSIILNFWYCKMIQKLKQNILFIWMEIIESFRWTDKNCRNYTIQVVIKAKRYIKNHDILNVNFELFVSVCIQLDNKWQKLCNAEKYSIFEVFMFIYLNLEY